MSNKKNLLIYAHYYIPDTASTGQILRELAEGMLDKFNITVICVVPSYLGTIEDKYKTQKYYEEEINGVKAVTLKDFELQAETDIVTGAKTEIKLPKSNVIQVILEDGTYITARPSGTEPKIKYYFGVNAKTESLVEEKMESMKKAFTEIVK